MDTPTIIKRTPLELTPDNLVAFLTEQGDTPDEIHDWLFEMGHWGHYGCGSHCPEASAITYAFGLEPNLVDVAPDSVAVYHPDDSMSPLFTVVTPEQVRQFINEYDRAAGRYRDLDGGFTNCSVFLIRQAETELP
jgi:hypothetical protein